MKKLLFIPIFFLISCQANEVKKNIDMPHYIETQRVRDKPHIRIIDGCEYIVIYSFRSSDIEHKGNCKNH